MSGFNRISQAMTVRMHRNASDSALSDLSFVVPSINGEERLLLICKWLQASNFTGKYIIVDATSEDRTACFEDFPFVKYLHRPKSDAIAAAVIGMQIVETEFSAFIGDDDVPLLSGYEKCVVALSRNTDYDSSHGYASYFDVKDSLEFSRLSLGSKLAYAIKLVASPRYDIGIDLSDANFDKRLAVIAMNYCVTQFFVTRTSLTQQLYNEVIANIGDIHISEYLLCYAQAAIARSLFVSSHYLMRGLGKHRPNSRVEEARHVLDASSSVEKKARFFVDSLSVTSETANLIYWLSLSQRYRSAIINGLNIKYSGNAKKYVLHQIKRLWFCSCFQSIERLKFIWWLRGESTG